MFLIIRPVISSGPAALVTSIPTSSSYTSDSFVRRCSGQRLGLRWHRSLDEKGGTRTLKQSDKYLFSRFAFSALVVAMAVSLKEELRAGIVVLVVLIHRKVFQNCLLLGRKPVKKECLAS